MGKQARTKRKKIIHLNFVSSNAIDGVKGVNIHTMVIHFQDTCATHTAMMRPIRFDYKAFFAVPQSAGNCSEKQINNIKLTVRAWWWRKHISNYRLLIGRSFANTSNIRRCVSWLSARARRSISLRGTRNCRKASNNNNNNKIQYLASPYLSLYQFVANEND